MKPYIEEHEVDLVLDALACLLEAKKEALVTAQAVHPHFTEYDFGIPKIEALIKKLEGEDDEH